MHARTHTHIDHITHTQMHHHTYAHTTLHSHMHHTHTHTHKHTHTHTHTVRRVHTWHNCTGMVTKRCISWQLDRTIGCPEWVLLKWLFTQLYLTLFFFAVLFTSQLLRSSGLLLEWKSNHPMATSMYCLFSDLRFWLVQSAAQLCRSLKRRCQRNQCQAGCWSPVSPGQLSQMVSNSKTDWKGDCRTGWL